MKLIKLFTLLVAIVVSLNAKDLELKAEMLKAWKVQVKEAHKVTKGITDKQLVKMMDDDEDFILVDVREPKEVAAGTIMAMEFKAIPRGMIAPTVGKALSLKPAQAIVLYCKAGARSALVAKELQTYYGFKNVKYLKGGITNWFKQGHEIHNKMGEFTISK